MKPAGAFGIIFLLITTDNFLVLFDRHFIPRSSGCEESMCKSDCIGDSELSYTLYTTVINPNPSLAALDALRSACSSLSVHFTLNSSHFLLAYSLLNVRCISCSRFISRGSPVPVYTTSSVHGGRNSRTVLMC